MSAEAEALIIGHASFKVAHEVVINKIINRKSRKTQGIKLDEKSQRDGQWHATHFEKKCWQY